MDNTIIITEEATIDNYVSEYDIAVCGYGGAGGSAAIEAANNNSQVILFERASDGGGSTALSSCEMYLGGSGGTSLQNACGFEDSSENMIAYIEASLEGKGDQKKIKLYCENAASHFEWVKSLGVNYKESAHLGRIVVPESNESLLFTGNERVSPFSECAKPIPRGHVPSHEGDFGGKIFFDALKKAISKTKNISVSFDSRVLGLVVDQQNVIVGVSFKKDNIVQHVKVKKGVILTAGGFVMNEEMINKYLSFQTSFGAPYGNAWDKGDGIQIGLAMNANVINMDEAFFGVYFYPPESLTYGIFVNSDGNRFVNEDSYGARIDTIALNKKIKKFIWLFKMRTLSHQFILINFRFWLLQKPSRSSKLRQDLKRVRYHQQ